MLRSRMNAPKRRLTMQLSEVDLGWLEKVERGLLEFKQSGHQVKLLRDKCRIVVQT
ncbi:hypothetical protein AGABI1DRAFT_110913 [Agaricus bisporus var. burnettii JB137-S8]|uniref:Uncharacterized protein n=1 Tax=Agaricus bisporus var. burnettii (strain JB137-S8 / ATCC MYA-4627 / FGSC 10392) TaxID=597362 RepID=K5X8X5_AGABU|nr:uncharacterized protein AGABI1DRAFT_110913 [Agaricus bisporus var. burnettii JB137-S8]EKM84391.1 hypothetical protein AGABI1DRAFT_110913 [Agaricus bisporus var. burnettii JB137-S8]